MGCGASAGGKYETEKHAWAEKDLHQPSILQGKRGADLTVGTGTGQLSHKAGSQVAPSESEIVRGAPRSYRAGNHHQSPLDSSLRSGGFVDPNGQHASLGTSQSSSAKHATLHQESTLQQQQSPPLHQESGAWEVQEFDGSKAGLDITGPVQHVDTGPTEEVFAAYNFFFEHIGLRKGWRTAPFRREDVQAHFWAAAEVVMDIRTWLDAQRGETGVVLRQVEGSAMNFLWGWNPDNPPASSDQAREDFFRGLVFATLSDGNGLVEGLEPSLVESFVDRHPFIGRATTTCEDACVLEASSETIVASAATAIGCH